MQQTIREFLDQTLNPPVLRPEEVVLSKETVEGIHYLERRLGLPAVRITELIMEWRLRGGPRALRLKEYSMPVETVFLIGVAVGCRERA